MFLYLYSQLNMPSTKLVLWYKTGPQMRQYHYPLEDCHTPPAHCLALVWRLQTYQYYSLHLTPSLISRDLLPCRYSRLDLRSTLAAWSWFPLMPALATLFDPSRVSRSKKSPCSSMWSALCRISTHNPPICLRQGTAYSAMSCLAIMPSLCRHFVVWLNLVSNILIAQLSRIYLHQLRQVPVHTIPFINSLVWLSKSSCAPWRTSNDKARCRIILWSSRMK